MANYCTKCGKPLVDGETCDCTNSTYASQTESTQSNFTKEFSEKVNASNFIVELKNTFISITKHPVSSGESYIQTNNLKLSLTFIIIQGILCGLFSVIFASKIGQGLTNLGGALSGMNSQIEALMKMPYFKGFIITAILSIVLSFVLATLLFIMNILFKNAVAYSQMIASVSLRSIFSIYVIVLSILVLLINPFASILCFFGGNILGMLIIEMTLPRNESSTNYLPYITFIAFFVFMIISIIVISKCWTIFIPEALKSGLGQFQNLLSDPNAFLNSIL